MTEIPQDEIPILKLAFTPRDYDPLDGIPLDPRRSFDLWMLAAMAFVPGEVIGAFNVPWSVSACAVAFYVGIGFHCFLRHQAGRRLVDAAWTGAWLMPLLSLLYFASEPNFPFWSAAILMVATVTSFLGILAGAIVTAQIDGALVIASLQRRPKNRVRPQRPPQKSIQEQIDDTSTPLEAPPTTGMPRRFGVRGLLIVTTWAALIMGLFRAFHAEPIFYWTVITFAAGILAAQVLLFEGRNPMKASMWAGAFLLPIEIVIAQLALLPVNPSTRISQFVFALVAGCACYVPGGILLGAAAGMIFGGLYFVSEESLLWITRGVPKITLEAATEADIDALLGWITGPKLCYRWAGDRFTWPLDSPQLLARFTAMHDRTVRKIYKAVDVRTGNMVGYVELGRIDYTLRSAWVELVLVDPNASERGRIGVRMLQALSDYAFGTLKLFSLFIISKSDQSELALCTQKACQTSFEHYAMANTNGEMWIATVRCCTPLAQG